MNEYGFTGFSNIALLQQPDMYVGAIFYLQNFNWVIFCNEDSCGFCTVSGEL